MVVAYREFSDTSEKVPSSDCFVGALAAPRAAAVSLGNALVDDTVCSCPSHSCQSGCALASDGSLGRVLAFIFSGRRSRLRSHFTVASSSVTGAPSYLPLRRRPAVPRTVVPRWRPLCLHLTFLRRFDCAGPEMRLSKCDVAAVRHLRFRADVLVMVKGTVVLLS